MPSDAGLDERLARVALAAFDVDGIFTDGRFTLDADGRDSVQFHTRDGMAVKLLLRAGVRVALVSGRDSKAGRIRAERLGIPIVRFAVEEKGPEMRKILADEGVEPDRALFAGDDLSDLPAFAAVGVTATVADAAPEVIARADLVTVAKGGAGAVREIAERILRASGRWEELIARYTT